MLGLLKGLRKEILLMFVGSFALLVLIQFITYWSLTQMDAAKAQARRSNTISHLLDAVLSDLKDVETGMRGYVLVGRPDFLEPYTAAMPQISEDFRKLEALIQDPSQQAALIRLKMLADRRITVASDIIAIQQRSGTQIAKKLILEGAGKRAMDELRQQVALMGGREAALANESDARAQSATNFARTLFVLGFLLALLLQGVAFVVTIREMNQRKEAEAAVNILNQELEAHVQELDSEIVERKKAESHVQQLNTQLQNQVELLNETNTTLNAVNRELESFAYSVSHDLRSPLRGLDGLSLALLEDYGDKIDPLGKSFLERMRSESQRMGELIDGILNLSRLTRGEVHKAPVDLSDIARKTLAELRAESPDRLVEMVVQDGLTVNADPRLMEAVLQNLLGNAWKFTAKHAEAHIEFGSEERDGKPVYFVKDDGAGFDMAYIDKMFGAFQRLHGVKEFPGTGIGLATVQRIVHRHGGNIWAEGAIEKGATFYFTLS